MILCGNDVGLLFSAAQERVGFVLVRESRGVLQEGEVGHAGTVASESE